MAVMWFSPPVGIADRHGVDIAAVASRYVLDTAAKAGCQAAVIVGMRGDSHLKETAAISSFRLDEEDFGAENALFMIPKRSFFQDRLETNIGN